MGNFSGFFTIIVAGIIAVVILAISIFSLKASNDVVCTNYLSNEYFEQPLNECFEPIKDENNNSRFVLISRMPNEIRVNGFNVFYYTEMERIYCKDTTININGEEVRPSKDNMLSWRPLEYAEFVIYCDFPENATMDFTLTFSELGNPVPQKLTGKVLD